MEDTFEYDVAFSFLASDEAMALQLNDLLQSRLRTFVYSKRQRELAGTDGENSFNAVFSEKARAVVILYREGWGETSWTRIEQTAIRNRAHEEGYDFSLFIPLDIPPTVPRWVPRHRLWIGLDRWGLTGAAVAIEQRVQELGGKPATETLESRAARHARNVDIQRQRRAALDQERGVAAFNQGLAEIVAALKSGVGRINAAQNSIILEFNLYNESNPLSVPYVTGLKDGFTLQHEINYSNSLDGAMLRAVIWDGSPPARPGYMRFDKPRERISRRFVLDYSMSGAYVWVPATGARREFGSGELADDLLRWYLDEERS